MEIYMDKNSVEKSNSFKLLVLDEISRDPQFFRRVNLIRYTIPSESQNLTPEDITGKVTAVLDLRNEGAFRVDSWEQKSKTEFKFVFYLQVVQPEFDQIHNKYKNQEQTDKIISGTSKLITQLPEGGKYKVVRKMATLFDKENKVKNYLLARCINPTAPQNGKRRKLGINDYKNSKTSYDKEIKNRFRILKKYWKLLGCTVKFRSESSEIVQTK